MRPVVCVSVLLAACAILAAPAAAQSGQDPWMLNAQVGPAFGTFGTTPNFDVKAGYTFVEKLSLIGEFGGLSHAEFKKAAFIAPAVNVPPVFADSKIHVNGYHYNANRHGDSEDLGSGHAVPHRWFRRFHRIDGGAVQRWSHLAAAVSSRPRTLRRTWAVGFHIEQTGGSESMRTTGTSSWLLMQPATSTGSRRVSRCSSSRSHMNGSAQAGRLSARIGRFRSVSNGCGSTEVTMIRMGTERGSLQSGDERARGCPGIRTSRDDERDVARRTDAGADRPGKRTRDGQPQGRHGIRLPADHSGQHAVESDCRDDLQDGHHELADANPWRGRTQKRRSGG